MKVGRPKNATGIIPTPQQLLCGDPNFNPNNPGASKNKQSSSAVLVQQALLQSKLQQKVSDIRYNQRLLISNFPKGHNEKLIRELCSYFGKVEAVELVNDQQGFTGSAYIEFENEAEAKKAFNQMMGLQVGSKNLYVKKMQPPTEEELLRMQREQGIAIHETEEIFKQIIEDKPTKCIVLKNVVSLQEQHEPEDFKELEFDVQDEMKRYGKVVRTHVPRPPKYGDPY